MAARDAAGFANRGTAIPEHTRVRIFPANGQGLVDLNVLAGLDTATAKNALVGIVAIKWICRVHFVGLCPEWDGLVLDAEKLGGVMDRAVAVIIVADGAVEQVIAENPVERFPLSGLCPGGLRGNDHPRRGVNPHALTSFPSTSTMHVARLGSESGMIAHGDIDPVR